MTTSRRGTYEEPEAGEWVQPRRKGYKLACCDCGLVHNLDFRIVKYAKNQRKIQFRAFRNNRATGQMRRWMKEERDGSC